MVKKVIRRCLVCKQHDGRPFPSPAVPDLQRKGSVRHLNSVLPESTLLDLCTYVVQTVICVIAKCMSVYSPVHQPEVSI